MMFAFAQTPDGFLWLGTCLEILLLSSAAHSKD
jgi:hypothetical protein